EILESFNFLPFDFYLFTFFSTPCDRAIFSIAELYPIHKSKSILFYKKISPSKNQPQKPQKLKKYGSVSCSVVRMINRV
ncbi:MAG: hypothetical protein ACFFDT_39240, partial [Candidatus Hodarchaeota archaeon]